MQLITRQLRDPRIYQITCLATLLAYGLTRLDFAISLPQVVTSLVAALATQLLLGKAFHLPRFDARSPLISGLSMCLLLRTNDLWLTAAGSAIAIATKFLIRRRGKHVFNPTNAGLVALLLVTERVWVSPGQWGSAAFLAFLFACLGGLVVNRAARSDVTYAFLIAYAGIVIGRSLWLGDPLAVPLHRLQNGALLLFAFFMISDPKTTPDRRAGRILFACLNAALGAVLIYGFDEPMGLLYTLAMLAPTVPVIDRLLPGRRYEWSQVRTARNEGENHASEPVPAGGPIAAPRPDQAPGAPAPAHAKHPRDPRPDRAHTPRPAALGAGLLRLLRGEGGRAALQ